MVIQDVVNLAKYSELSSVSIKDDINVIVAFLNLGMLELYKRFPVKVEEHVVELLDAEPYYDMPANFMYATCAFGEVPELCDSDYSPIGINNEDDKYSIFFNDWNTIQVPFPSTGSFIAILYVTKPAVITTVQATDGTTTLDLPEVLIDALLHYIGYRAHLGIKSDSQAENNAHWARFERSCKKAIDLGVAFPSDSMSMSGRVTDRGFA
jgi:hypothetical protein